MHKDVRIGNDEVGSSILPGGTTSNPCVERVSFFPHKNKNFLKNAHLHFIGIETPLSPTGGAA